MDIPKIYSTQTHFKISTNDAQLIIPKNETNFTLIEIITPHLEKAKNDYNQLHPQMLSQLHNVLELIQLFKDCQPQLNECVSDEIMIRLEETYYFIYDLLKLMEIEIPGNFFIKKSPF